MPAQTRQDDIQVSSAQLVVITAAAGYSVGDSISVVRIFDNNRGNLLATDYYNNTTGLKLATVNVAHFAAPRQVVVQPLYQADGTGFLRKFVYTATGEFVAAVDTELDGTTPFVAVGAVTIEQPAP